MNMTMNLIEINTIELETGNRAFIEDFQSIQTFNRSRLARNALINELGYESL